MMGLRWKATVWILLPRKGHLSEAAVDEILAGMETSDEEGGSSSGEDDGDDGDMGTYKLYFW